MIVHHTPPVALVTGANSGVGLELTRRVLSEGWHVIALVRSDFPADDPLLSRARAAGQLRVYHADVSNFEHLKRALQHIKAQEERIDVLFNNAGAAINGIHMSPQGREMHFEVNTVAPYVIVMEMKPLLEKGTLKTIVNTSSNALLFVKRFDLKTLEHPTTYKPITGPYGASKLGLSLWTQELAPALKAEGIEIRSVNPGGNKTKMTMNAHFPTWMIPLRNLFFSHPRVGAARLYDVAVGTWPGKTGMFVHSGKATPLKFVQHARRVLETVQTIYEQEFLAISTQARRNG